MNYTHDFELQIGGYTYEGQCEFTSKGVLAYEFGDSVPESIKLTIGKMLELLVSLPVENKDIGKFEITKKSE
jgi:hypothetical protein